ncbi:MAG: hypothetical protein SNJ49_14545 [Chloracidobacterium sp.]
MTLPSRRLSVANLLAVHVVAARVAAGVVLCLGMAGVWGWAVIQSELTPAHAQTQAPQPPPTGCAMPGGSTQVLTSSYYWVASDVETTLLLNNKSPQPLTVQPTLFGLDGQRHSAPPLTIAGQSFRVVPLAELGAREGTAFGSGSVALAFEGAPLVLGAQVEMKDRRGRLVSDRLSDARVSLATTWLAGVYRLPRGGALKVAVTNVTERPVGVRVRVDGKDGKGVRFELGGRATRLVDVGLALGEVPRSGGVVVESDEVGAVRANGWVWNAAGYVSVVSFMDLGRARDGVWHANGVRVRPLVKGKVTPYVTVHNFGARESEVRGWLVGRVGEAMARRELETVRLGAGETRTLAVVLSEEERRGMQIAGIELAYGSGAGTIGAAVDVEREDGARGYRVPVVDREMIPSATGSYPVRLGMDENTVVYLKNTTDKEVRYHASVRFERGEDYGFGQAKLGPGETVMIDLRRVELMEQPDARGERMPSWCERGQFFWSVQGVETKGMVGRAEYLDSRTEASSTYACYNCCGDLFGSGWITGPGALGVTQVRPYRAFEQYLTCYGGLHVPQLAWVQTWEYSSANGAGAVVQPGQSEAEVSGNHIGEMALLARWTAYDCNLGSFLHTAWFPVQVKPLVTLQSVGPFNPATITAGDTSKCLVTVSVEGFTTNLTSLSVSVNVVKQNMIGFGQISVTQPHRTIKVFASQATKSEEVEFVSQFDPNMTDEVTVQGQARIVPSPDYVIEPPDVKVSPDRLTVNKP